MTKFKWQGVLLVASTISITSSRLWHIPYFKTICILIFIAQ